MKIKKEKKKEEEEKQQWEKKAEEQEEEEKEKEEEEEEKEMETVGFANQQKKRREDYMYKTNLKNDIGLSIPSQHRSILYCGTGSLTVVISSGDNNYSYSVTNHVMQS